MKTSAQRAPQQHQFLPLTPIQAHLWAALQRALEVSLPPLRISIDLQGEINLLLLERSLADVIQRHPSLRTIFSIMHGTVQRQILPALSVPLRQVDLRGLTADRQELELQRYAAAEEERLLALAGEQPRLQLLLLQLASRAYRLLIFAHPLIADVASAPVLLRDLVEAYDALRTGQPLPPHRSSLSSLEQQASETTYHAMGEANGPYLPTDHPRAEVYSYRPGLASRPVDEQLSAALVNFQQQEQVTLDDLIRVAAGALLARYTNEQYAMLGACVRKPQLQQIVGACTGIVALHLQIDVQTTTRTLLEQVRVQLAQSQLVLAAPFLVDLAVPRSASYSLPDCSFALREVLQILPAVDMRLGFSQDAQDQQLLLHYNAALFEAATAERLLEHFQVLLLEMLAHPDAPVCELPLLTPVEQQTMVYEWNATDTPPAAFETVPALFAAQVARRPNASALVFGERVLSYAQLDARANQLAHYLCELGVGPDSLVGLCVERSIEMVVGILGVLKAGGAYVPLDPGYPPDRLAFMLEDAQLQVLLTQQALLERLPAQRATTICLDTDWEGIATRPDTPPNAELRGDHLAYMIYTSGSTGRPKGVLVEQCGLCNVAEAQMEAFDISPDSRILQFSSISFDASIFEIVMAWRAGATLVVASREQILPGVDLARLLHEQAITTITIPPSALAAVPAGPYPALRTIIVAGEACSPALVARWAPGRRFFNAYGPTESTIWATVTECFAGDQRIHIGRPIRNTQIYILDQLQRPVPVGVAGEMYIGGIGIARGYLGRADLNAVRFLPDPFRPGPRARLYRTGDLGRFLSDGRIEFLGRIDHQVKVRGFRIELSEIELTLQRHPEVQECLVLVREDVPGDKRLVAYFIPRASTPPSTSTLHTYLSDRLPDYMIPSAFVAVEHWPLTPNGKVDRAALPRPTGVRPDLLSQFEAPRTPEEETLAAIWCEVLGLKQVGIHDNFFELGGDSILGIQVLSKANAWGLGLSARQLFHSPTIAELGTLANAANAEREQAQEPGRRLSRVNEQELAKLARLINLYTGEGA